MSDDDRIAQMLQTVLESGCTPTEACAAAPELLGEVQRRWENCRLLEAELNCLFPSQPGTATDPDLAENDTAPELLPEIPGYEVESVLGRGGMGVVYKARHVKLRRAVAVKMLLFGRHATGVEIARFLQEARTIASLRHPHVVQVHDVGECGGLPYFTMEWLEGGSLAERLGGAPQPPARAAALLFTLADAVDCAHRSGIIHRDLKPSNVLLTAEGLPRISDFGLARQLGEADDPRLTMSGQQVGTRSYMAPEQASPKWGPVGPAADVYALGAMLYEMLTGRPPFFGDSAAETERQLLTEDPVPPSRLNARVPRDLETICLACLRKDSSRRYASAAALAADVGRFQRGEPIAARPSGTTERVIKWVRRRPAAATTLAGGVLVVIALAGIGLWLVSQRAATARLVEDDLQDVVRFERRLAWPDARASLERAKVRLGNGGPAPLRARITSGERHLGLVARLDAVRVDRATDAADVVNLIDSYVQYSAAFREAGLGAIGDDPVIVAARIKALDIRPVIIDALDDWAVCTDVTSDLKWLTEVARRADGEPTDWRARAREPAIWNDKAALAELASVAPQPDASASLLVSLGDRMRAAAGNSVAIPFLERVQHTHPADYWASLACGEALQREGRSPEAVRYYQAAVSIRPDAAVSHLSLGEALSEDFRTEEALEEFHVAARLNPASFRPHFNIATLLARRGRYGESIGSYADAQRLISSTNLIQRLPGMAPNAAAVLGAFAKTQHLLGNDTEAIALYRQALAAYPRDRGSLSGLRSLLLAQGRREEVLADWRKTIESDPVLPHSEWQGYAELCLFLGKEEEYRRTCQALLGRFGASNDASIAERTGRTCLLLPVSEDTLLKATALIDRAVASIPPGTRGLRPYYLFAKGLAEYRAGRFETAIAQMKGEAGTVLQPGPGLVQAMAEQRLGHAAEARFLLAACADAMDWSDDQANTADNWMYHALRREADTMIVPRLGDYLAGTYQPGDNNERVAMTAACQFKKMYVARARLWSDVLAAEPRWGFAGRRFLAGAAALASSGRGNDAGALTDADRARLRAQARDCIRAELAAADATLKEGNAGKQRLLLTLMHWTTSYELAGVRDKTSLEHLPATERAEWTALWPKVDALLNRVQTMK